MSYADRETSRYSGSPIELYRFAQSGQAWHYTSADQALTLAGAAYAPIPISRGQIDQSQEDQAGGLEVNVPADTEIVAMFRGYLPSSPVTITIQRCHRGEPETVTLFVGTVASVSIRDGAATLSCSPVAEALRRQVPSMLYQCQCAHALYGPACGVLRQTYRRDATVVTISGPMVTLSGLSEPDGWLLHGYVVTSSGEIRWITHHAAGQIRISAPLAMAVGDVVQLYAGCDRTETACRAKFDNLPNYGGWTRIPHRNPMDGAQVW